MVLLPRAPAGLSIVEAAGPRGASRDVGGCEPSTGQPNPFDLGSANGERRAEPPRREGRRLPAALTELGDLQRREFHEALLEAASFEDLPGRWQAAILEAEPKPTNAHARLNGV
jgi:hypothetical protein